ncbi:MAG: SMC-Scp complex subunit ScpB [Planctomycetes bacterium]|nr:SMC-Scp complex subunit ScpB [Planctomycetota bacterium]
MSDVTVPARPRVSVSSSLVASRRAIVLTSPGFPTSWRTTLHWQRTDSPHPADLRWLRADGSGPRLIAATADTTTLRTAKMARLETALFVAEEALTARRLMQVATLASVAEARELIDRLNRAYDVVGSAFRIECVAKGYRLLTRPEFAPWLDRLHSRSARLKLSPPAMETLAIVAYRQPITRADIEAIRGVQCADVLKWLMDRDLIRIAGEDNSLGRPFLYATTRKFLETFGLGSLDDLPMADRLRPSRQPAAPAESQSPSHGSPPQPSGSDQPLDSVA